MLIIWSFFNFIGLSLVLFVSLSMCGLYWQPGVMINEGMLRLTTESLYMSDGDEDTGLGRNKRAFEIFSWVQDEEVAPGTSFSLSVSGSLLRVEPRRWNVFMLLFFCRGCIHGRPCTSFLNFILVEAHIFLNSDAFFSRFSSFRSQFLHITPSTTLISPHFSSFSVIFSPVCLHKIEWTLAVLHHFHIQRNSQMYLPAFWGYRFQNCTEENFFEVFR